MNTIKFGVGQIFKATPDEVKKTLTIATILIGFIIAGVSGSNLIPALAKSEINVWLGSGLVAIHSVGALFGVEINSSSVPTDKVTSVKE